MARRIRILAKLGPLFCAVGLFLFTVSVSINIGYSAKRIELLELQNTLILNELKRLHGPDWKPGDDTENGRNGLNKPRPQHE